MKGYEGLYEVSCTGRVRSLIKRVPHILRLSPMPAGYLTVGLHKDRIQRTHSVHALVAQAFMGDRPTGYQVNHKNAIKSDNALLNLEYVTPSQNRSHSFALGNESTAGENSRTAKLTKAQVSAIRKFVASGEKQRDVGDRFRVTQSAVSLINSGKRWL